MAASILKRMKKKSLRAYESCRSGGSDGFPAGVSDCCCSPLGWLKNTLPRSTGIAWMFIIYALGLLANFNTETSTGILQVTDKIELQGVINLTQSILATLIIGAAFLWNGTLQIVLGAYLLGKIILGLGHVHRCASFNCIKCLALVGGKFRFQNLPPHVSLIRFAVSSNISATIIKIFRESELLWVALFPHHRQLSGYYRVAYTIVSFIAIPADPFISTTFPEINRLVVQKAWPQLKDFLRKITTLSFAYNLALGLGFVLFGRWIILIYSGEKYSDAYPALIALTIGFIFNYILFWNRPLLLSLGLPEFPIWVTLAVGLVKLALAFSLVPRFGIVASRRFAFVLLHRVGGHHGPARREGKSDQE